MIGDDCELFAYGQSGYGTLQEYLILRQHLEAVRPDVVLWQMCVNDLHNNCYYLDARSFWAFNGFPRPFLEDGEIRIRCPHDYLGLGRRSQLWQYLVPRLMRGAVRGKQSYVDKLPVDSPQVREAVSVTDDILEMAGNLLGSTPRYAFVVGRGERADALYALAKKHGFRTVDHFSRVLHEVAEGGTVIYAHLSIGAHWSEEGHAAVARILHRALVEDGTFGATNGVAFRGPR
jgi:hypothetical protein